MHEKGICKCGYSLNKKERPVRNRESSYEYCIQERIVPISYLKEDI